MIVLIGYGSNGNGGKVWERMKWMVYHCDRKYLPQRLPQRLAIAIAVTLVHVSGKE